jgi:hypothetical protein
MTIKPSFVELPVSSPPAGKPPLSPRPPPAAAAAAARPMLYLATPCFGCAMALPYLASVLALQGMCMQRGVQVLVDFIGNESLVQRARNVLTARFLKSQATHLLFIDADIAFDPATVFRLLDFDKDVATAVYPKKMIDWPAVEAKLAQASTEPIAQMGLDFNINIAGQSAQVQDGFIRVLDSATGFMLIQRGVLERMCARFKDELHCVNDIIGTSQSVPDYVAVFDCMIDPESRRYLSEDYAFCRRLQQMGGEIWADVASPLAHLGTQVYSGDIRHRFALSYVH